MAGPDGDDTRCFDERTRPWVRTAPGVWSQLLRVHSTTGTWVLNNRFEPGYQAPRHRHTGEVHAFTTRGRWHYLEYGFMAEAGSYVHEAAGATHTLVVPADNEGLTEVSFVIEGANINLDEHDRITYVTDAMSMLRVYLDACEREGLGRPEGIVQ